MSKDINFSDAGCNYTLGSGLNYYSQTFDFKDSKRWALEWIKDNLPGEYERLQGAKDHLFSNRGFVCRMVKMGLKIMDDQVEALKVFFANIKTVPANKDVVEVVKRKPAEKVNEVIFQLEDVVDQILSDQEPSSIVYPVDKAQLTSAQAWIEKQIVDAQEQVAKHQAILSQLEAALEKCGGIKEKIALPKKAAPKNGKDEVSLEKANAAKTMQVLKKDAELGLETLSPAKIVGAKEVMVYNAKYRCLVHYVAEPGKVLGVSGSRIRNFDETKSTVKTLRKPAEVLAAKDLWKAYDAVKATAKQAGARVSDQCLILAVK